MHLTSEVPKVHSIKDIMQIKSKLDEDGYAVVKVMSPSEARALLQQFQKWLCSLDSRVDLQNPSKEWFPDTVAGIIKSYGVGHAPFMWAARTHPNVLRVFSQIWGTTELITSFDGASYIPHQFATPNFRLWPHCDLHPKRFDKVTCYQGLVNLIPNDNAGDGGFVVWKGTHKLRDWCAKLPEKCAQVKSDYFQIPNDMMPHIDDARRLIVPEGALILWDSRVIHCNSPPVSPIHNRDRAVVYVCMMPKSLASNAVLSKRRKWAAAGRTTSHSPITPRVNKDAIVYNKSTCKLKVSRAVIAQSSPTPEMVRLIG
jgi:hypothetical protein